MSRPAALLFALLVALLALAPGIAALPPLDRDESRFAQASKQMVETGDLVDIRFQEEPRYKKPVGAYWLQAASATVFASDRIWSYRLPSLLAIAGSAAIVFALGRLLFGGAAAGYAGLFAAVTLMAALEARQAKSDALLLVTVLLAQWALARHYLAARAGSGRPYWGWRVLLWAALGLGILVKGPIAPLVSVLTVIALSLLDRDWRWWRSATPAWGPFLTAVIAAPWLIAIGIATKGAFFAEALGHDLGAKLAGGQESHGAPPGYYILLLALTAWPGALLLPQAVEFIRVNWRKPPVRFCLSWIIPAWLMFEAVPTKLPHYVLPLLPAVILLATAALSGDRSAVPAPAWSRRLEAVLKYWVLAGGLLVGGAVLAAPLAVGAPPEALLLAVPAALAAWAGTLLVWAGGLRRQRQWIGMGLGATALALGLVFGFVGPALQPLWISRDLAHLIRSADPAGSAPVLLAGYSEPSAIFLLGTATRLGDGAAAAQALMTRAASIVAVSGDQESAFQAALSGASVRTLGTVEGLNYSRGKKTTLTVYTR
jgi:4-amino-4-deoxy-L-arabinose transferase-like glycosyltransferase